MNGDEQGTEEADQVRSRLLAYLTDRRDWELLAWQRSGMSSDPDAPFPEDLPDFRAEETSEYEVLVARFVHQNARGAGFSYRDPPSVDPALTDGLDIEVHGSNAVVTTRESTLPPPHVQEFEYEYHWRREDDTWWLTDRRSRGEGGRWIRGIF